LFANVGLGWTCVRSRGTDDVSRKRDRSLPVPLRVVAGILSVVVLATVALLTIPSVFGFGASSSNVQVQRPAQRSAQSLLTSTDNLPADCIPNPSGPPSSHYQLGLVGNVTSGVLTAGPATVANLTAKFCGIVTVVGSAPPCGATGTVYSPQDGQIFGAVTAQLTFIPGMQPKVPFVAHPGRITGGFKCAAPSSQGLVVDLDATVSGSTGLYGLSCTIGPLTIPLTGLITGPLDDLSGTLTASNFAVPGVTPSSTCAGQVPASLDQIAGLPIKPGGATAKITVTGSLYQPPPPG
jgi:hypothetical protein